MCCEVGIVSVTVGIDNGITGGLAVIGPHGHMIDAIPMPSQRWRKRNEVDVRAVHLWLTRVTAEKLSDALYVIEEPNNSRTPSTAYSVASSFHSLRGFFETKRLRWKRITPQSWQKEILGKVPQGETKPYALSKAMEIWPDERFLASDRCKKAHEGMIDAALIARYGLIKWGDLQQSKEK